MAKRRKPKNGSSTGKKDYEVGRGKPPKHTQFKPGQSGNPAGRPKGLRNFATDLKEVLATQRRVRDGDRVRTMSTQQALLLVQAEKGVRGNDRAAKHMLDFAVGVSPEGNETGIGQALSPDDQAILQRYKTELLAPLTSSKTTESSDRPTSGVRRRKPSNE